MWPISVPMPVAVTIISPRPRVTAVFMKAMQRRSPRPTSGLSIAAVSLSVGVLSPVRAASSISSVAATKQAAVGGDAVARLHQHDVARHQPLGVDLDRLPVAAHAGDGLEHLLQRRQAGLGLGLPAQAQHGVEDGQADQHERRPHLAGDDQADHGGRQQDDLHEVAVLAQEGREPGLLPSWPPVRLGP